MIDRYAWHVGSFKVKYGDTSQRLQSATYNRLTVQNKASRSIYDVGFTLQLAAKPQLGSGRILTFNKRPITQADFRHQHHDL